MPQTTEVATLRHKRINFTAFDIIASAVS